MLLSKRPELYAYPSHIRSFTFLAALAIAIAVALLCAASAAAAAPNPNARDHQQQTAEPELPVPTLTAHPAATAVELRWTEIPGAHRYELLTWWDADTGWQTVSDSITATAYTHTEVTPGTTYFYAIRALDAAGEALTGWSHNIPATVPAASADQPQPSASTPTPTSTPAQAQATAAATTAAPQLTAQPAPGAVVLRWTEPPGAHRYELLTWWDADTGWQTVSDSITDTNYTHTEVTPGTTYFYVLRALDAAGEALTGWSDSASADPLPAFTPTPTPTSTPASDSNPLTADTPTTTPTPPLTTTPAPTTSTLSAPQLTAQPAAGEVRLTWEELSAAARYELLTWWNQDTGWQTVSDSITATTYTHNEVTPGTTYFYTIRALDAAGEALTGWSDYASADPLPAFTPTPTPTSTPASNSNPLIADTPTTTLTPTTTPTPTPPLTTTPLPLTPAPTTSTLSAPQLTAQPAADEVRLTWEELPGAARYELWTWWNQDTGWQTVSDSIAETTYTHTELTAGTTYFYAIRALDAAGNAGPWSEYASAAPLPASTATPTLTPTSTTTPDLTPALTSTPASTPTPTPTAASSLQLPPPPASLDLDPYYRKYLDADGIPVVASSDVDDLHLYHARDILNAMLSKRSDLRATMTANRFRVVIYRHDGCRGPFQTPELRDELPIGRCTNTIGRATIRWFSNHLTGEVLLIVDAVGIAPSIRQPYCNVVLVHEFAHMVHYAFAIETALSGSRPLFDSPFDSRLKGAFSSATQAGLYSNAYASTNYQEYWAEAVVFWFLPDMLTAKVSTPATVAQLADHDPGIAAIVQEVFRDAALPDCEPIYVRVLGNVTGSGGQPLAGITVSADLRVRAPSDHARYSSVSHSLPTEADGAYRISIYKPGLASLQRTARRETGESDLESLFLLAVANQEWDPATGCPAGYLAPAGQVQNISPQNAAEHPIPQTDLTGISLTTAPSFAWTPRLAC